MGREILYCSKCGKALTADDFTRGRAHTYDHRQYCTPCVPKPKATRQASPKPSQRIPVVRVAAVPPKRSAAPMILSLVAASGVVALLVVMLRPSPPAGPDPAEKAREAVAEAREIARAQPTALEEIVRAWDKAVAASAGTPVEAEAKRERDRARSARKEALARELKDLEEKVRERMEAERFGAVVDVLEEARRRHENPDWVKAIEARVQEVRTTTDARYPALKEKATTAHARGQEERVKELRGALALWGRPDLASDLEAALAAIVPREPLPAGANVLMRYPQDPRPYNLAGKNGKSGLLALPYGKGAMMGGFEVFRPPFPIPERGEFRLTYSTRSAEPIVLRFRIVRGDKTIPYNWELKAPEVGRPARVKAPLRDFMNYDNQIISVGDLVQSIYIQQDDPAAELTFIEAVIFSQP